MFREVLYYIALFSGFLPPLFFRYKKWEYSQEVRFMAPFVWLVGFATLYEIIGSLLLQIKVNIWFRAYTLMEFICLFYFFYRLFGVRYKKIQYAFAAVFGITFIYTLFLWNTVPHFTTDSYLATVETIYVLAVAFLWFKDMFTNLELVSLWNSTAFYFISAMVLYFSGTIFLFAMSETLLVDKSTSLYDYWIINIFLTLVLRILLIVAIWKGQQKLIRYSG